MDDRELTMVGPLADPMTLALMAADNVDVAELTADWTALARSSHSPVRRNVGRSRRSSGQGRIELVNFSQDQIR
jgi:hypothetical protein